MKKVKVNSKLLGLHLLTPVTLSSDKKKRTIENVLSIDVLHSAQLDSPHFDFNLGILTNYIDFNDVDSLWVFWFFF